MVNWKNKAVGLGTDGASVMTGVRGGLGVLLQRDIPQLIQGHGVEHKLELAVMDACKTSPNLWILIKAILRFHSHSSKRIRE